MVKFLAPISIVISGAIAGCAIGNPAVPGDASISGMHTSAYPITRPDGTDVWHIECPGFANDWGKCFARANHLCENGFMLLEQKGSEGGAAVTASPTFAAGGQRTERIAIVKCK